MKKTVVIWIAAFLILFTSCGGGGQGASSSASSKNEVSSGAPDKIGAAEIVNMGELPKTDLVTPVTVENSQVGDAAIIADRDALHRETVRLPEFESMTTEMIEDAVYNDDAIRVSMVSQREFLAVDAVAALKMKFYGGKYAQFIGMRGLDERTPDGANEQVVHDPVPESLDAYEGIRFWLHLASNTDNNPGFEVVFFMGALANGDNGKYRTMYECKVNVPAGFKGYVECPFENFTNYYNGQKAVSKQSIDYFAVKMTADNGNTAGIDAYVSGFQAYRDIFW